MSRFTAENCSRVAADKTLHAVGWKGVDDLLSLANQRVCFRLEPVGSNLRTKAEELMIRAARTHRSSCRSFR
jgi:hypothetical protein